MKKRDANHWEKGDHSGARFDLCTVCMDTYTSRKKEENSKVVEGVVPIGQRIMERLSDDEELIVDCQSGKRELRHGLSRMRINEKGMEQHRVQPIACLQHHLSFPCLLPPFLY